jgi:hypothetical protein
MPPHIASWEGVNRMKIGRDHDVLPAVSIKKSA